MKPRQAPSLLRRSDPLARVRRHDASHSKRRRWSGSLNDRPCRLHQNAIALPDSAPGPSTNFRVLHEKSPVERDRLVAPTVEGHRRTLYMQHRSRRYCEARVLATAMLRTAICDSSRADRKARLDRDTAKLPGFCVETEKSCRVAGAPRVRAKAIYLVGPARERVVNTYE